MSDHRIVSVTYVPRTNDGPLLCTCGDEMQASRFGEHRRSLGLKVGGFSDTGGDGTPSVWGRRSINPECRVQGCYRKTQTSGFCGAHYERSRRGAPLEPPIATPRRGFARV